MDARVEAALRRAALWTEVKDKLKQSGLSLSGGQQQRLCIARGVAVKPTVLLLDEPCSALDPISTSKVEELIDELKSDYCIVIVTHNMQQAARAADFTAFMYLGELIEYGETEQIFTKPAPGADPAIHHRALRMTPLDHTVKSYDEELKKASAGYRQHGPAGRVRAAERRCRR